MAACDILYSSKDKQRLRVELNKALRAGSVDLFTKYITEKYTTPKEIRLTPKEGDTEAEVVASMRDLDQDIQELLRSWDAMHPDSPQFDSALSQIRETLNFVDETQTATTEEDVESKTKGELLDKNSANLRDHLAEFYGLEAFDITSGLKRAFEDMMASAAYYDINSGTIIDQTTKSLNNNIKLEKAKLFRELVQYMKQHLPADAAVQKLSDEMFLESGFNSKNYYQALNLFYSRVAKADDFKDSLKIAYANHVRGDYLLDKTNLYKALVVELLTDDTFKSRMQRKFTGNRYINFQSQLYTADHYSEYYAAIKNYIEKHRPELIERLTAIEQSELSILNAANAYTMLRHFDSLLKDTYGDQISVSSSVFGYEADIADKYTYHVDTAHERKDWQTSEDISSEKHISRFTKAVIDMIRIYNYKTGEFLHRRADGTTLIVAARNLINAVLTKKVTLRSDTPSVQEAMNTLEEHVLDMHDDPVVHLQKVLETLFEKVPGASYPLIYYIENAKAINDYDLSVLGSVYNTVFNAQLPQSFYSQSKIKASTNSTATQSLLEEIAGYVDRNVTAAYLETVFDYETGATTVRAKKKFFNNKQLYKLQTGINTFVNKMAWTDREAIETTYGFRISETDDKNNTRYIVRIGNEEIALKVPNNLRGQILSRNLDKDNGASMSFDMSEGLLSRLSNINLIEFRQKIEMGAPLDADENTLRNIMKFLDDTLGLGILTNPNMGLQTLYSYQSLYNPVDNFKNYLQPLLKMGIRAAYVNHQYVSAGENSDLATYLKESKDPVYAFHESERKSKLFTARFNHLQYQVASYADGVLNLWTDAQSILRGEASKATTKDKQGNSIPNNSVAKLGGILHYYLGKQFDTLTDSLMFVKNRDMIVNTFHDLEVTNMSDETKSIRGFSNSELFFHSIFNKFWGSYLSNGTVIVQPTTYSDKTTFLNWELNTELDGTDLLKADRNTILQAYSDTIGTAYKRVLDNTTQKLTRIANQFAADNQIQDITDFRDILHLMTEPDLVRTAAKLGLDVELNKDYRIIKDNSGKKVVGVNGLLEYNANLYTDSKALGQRLEEEKLNFLNQLLLNGCAYQALEGTDTIDMYITNKVSEKATSRNPILSTILRVYTDLDARKGFLENWVDTNTGKLILAKQGDNNIISVSDSYNESKAVKLNPLLDKFFYIEGLLSNNLRYSLTGFEVNHPAGKNSPFNAARSSEIVINQDWNKLRDDTLSAEDWAQVKKLLDSSIDVDSLNRKLVANKKTMSNKAIKAVAKLLEDSYIYATNTSQGTQFKRNVIIPATLQYCTQNVKNGIPKYIKCAIVRDEGAPVFNYRGDHEDDIDSCDGSAKITPFQCILENKALGSQAVGFIKKPIWHAYDADSGTAFLAKFATNTMTNEEMRMSMMSNTSVHNIFKKATNLQWDDPRIDLTKSLVRNQSFGNQEMSDSEYRDWFGNVILGGHELFYENQYGDKIEIKGFNKTTLQDGSKLYYTLERNPKTQSDQGELTKRYHIFYDEVLENGKVDKSRHITVDTWQQAAQTIADLNAQGKNAHTINSLFELHSALGGVYCVDKNGKGSEYNNEVVVNFMNNVGWVKDPSKRNQFINQATYEQPLKKYQIGYILNASAVKNGAKNINQSNAWYDDTEFTYFNVASDGLGMQMNADHDIVNSELTEFSQVIAATTAYGYTFDQTTEILQGLAKTAFQASEKTLNAIDSFIANMNTENKQQALSNLYDSIGRILLVNHSIKDKESLTNIVMQAVQKVFNKYSDHTNDEVKIPFSDPNVYSEFIATLASTITRNSIKRTHPGSGCVMVSGYDMIQYFEIPRADGTFEKVMTSNIINKARAAYKAELIQILATAPGYNAKTKAITLANGGKAYLNGSSLESLIKLAKSLVPDALAQLKYYTTLQDPTEVNKHLMAAFLAGIPSQVRHQSYFMPSDIVDVLDADGNVIETVDLNSLDKYYNFKNGISRNGTPYPKGCVFRVSTTHPHNLRPSLIRWQYMADITDADGNVIGQEPRYMNAFDLPAIKNAYLNHQNRDANYRIQVQNALHDLHAGKFTDDAGIEHSIIEGTLENTEAELVMSNIYKETFGIGNETLPEILDKGEKYFRDQLHNLKAPSGYVYDIAFLRGNGKHTMISIGNVKLDDTTTEIPFTNTMTNEKGEIILIKNGREMFEVGRWGDPADDSISYDDNTKRFVSSKDGKVDQTMYRLKDGKLQQRYDYVKQYNVVTKKVTDKGITYQTNTLYKISHTSVFQKAMNSTFDDAFKQQASIIRKIYCSGDYKLAQINAGKSFSENQRNSIKNSLQFLLGDRTIDNDVKEVLKAQLDHFSDNAANNIKVLTEVKNQLLDREAHKRWISFLDSQKFIASRIPAQTLQSFMAMKLIGWTENSKNMCYVSHFQTYLQGSK